MIRKIVGSLIVFGCLLSLTARTSAQTTFGAIEGTIVDQTGGRVPGVAVTVKNMETGLTRLTTTDERGFFRVNNIDIGRYSVTAQIDGFSTAIREGVEIQINRTGIVDFTLKPSTLAESVTVQAETVQVNTVSSTIGHVIENKKIMDLPLNGRSFDQLISLVPGAIDTGGLLGWSVNGARPGANNFLLNGTDANNNYFAENVSGRNGVSYTSLGLSSVENIQEFVILTNTYSAEYGRTAGAQVNVVTKTGTNRVRGSLFEFYRGTDLQARNFFFDRRQPRPEFTKHQFGGSVGGPIRRNRMFFYFSYEGLRESTPQTQTSTVPTQAFIDRAGAVFTPFLSYMRAPTEPFMNPDGSISPYIGRLSYTADQYTDENAYAANVLYQLSPSDAIRLNAQIDGGEQSREGQLNRLATSGLRSWNRIVNATHTHTFGSSLVNEARLGYNYGPRNFYYYPYGIDYPEPLLGVTITSVFSFGNSGGWSYYPTSVWQFVDNLNWVKGRQRLKFGVDVRTVAETFDNGPTQSVTYATLDDFFANRAQTVSLSLSHQGAARVGINSYAGYVQDDVQVLKNLNVNLGLRYEYLTPAKEQDLKQSSFNVVTRQLEVGQPLYASDRNNFSPRVGFAWDVGGNGRTAVRAGWGIFYDSLNPTQFIFQANNPPFRENISISRANNPDLAWPLPATYTKAQLVSVAYGFDYNVRQPYVQQYNANLQRQLARDLMLDIGYVGSQGTGLLRNQDINRVNPATRARPDARYSNIIIREGTARSEFNSLQIGLTRRFRDGLAYQASYTFGKLRDDGSSSYDNGQDMANLDGEWAPSNFDRRHQLVANFIYELPFGHNHRWGSNWGGVLNAIAGGWQTNGIFTARTGAPLTVRPGADVAGDGSAGTQRVDVVPGVDPYLPNKGINGWLNPAAFRPAAPGTYGNSGRNAYRGPGLQNLDLSLFKSFTIPWFEAQSSTMQIRIEAFNVFNTPNFNNPIATLNNVNFGKITSAVSPGVGTNTGAPRIIQVAAKLLF